MNQENKLQIEVADIFRQYGKIYRESRKIPVNMLKAMSAIEKCRTAELGGHVDECDSCGHKKISYNSCRNRHCPKCQGLAREKWITARKEDLLPVKYFHMVFTIPNELNQVVLRNQKILYDILFKASAETLIELTRDKKYLGVEAGFISILHTWGQNLMDHPHVHCIIPGGGLSFDGRGWIHAKKRFLLPVKVLSKLFRGKFLFYLKEAYKADKLKFVGQINWLSKEQQFQDLINKLYNKEWVVYCKPTFKSPLHVIEYLGRYTHRVAISNSRIVKMEHGKVTFRWKDYRDNNKNKLMTLDANEFIRRFLLHILPDNYVKIRHYGLLSNRNRKTKLKSCQRILGDSQKEVTNDAANPGDISSFNLLICPCCGNGRMVRSEQFSIRSRFFTMKKIIA